MSNTDCPQQVVMRGRQGRESVGKGERESGGGRGRERAREKLIPPSIRRKDRQKLETSRNKGHTPRQPFEVNLRQ